MNSPLSESIKVNVGTFSFDNQLPKLPVPTIAETFELYLSSVRAISSTDISVVETKVEQFLISNEAKLLQDQLLSRSEYMNNWLENWWLEEAYLKDRSPVIPDLNIAGRSTLYKSVWPIIDRNGIESNTISQEIVRRAARYVYSLMLFWICLRVEIVVPHRSKDGEQLSMDQMRRVFNTCRVPNDIIDSLHCSFRTAAENKCPSHIIVGCYGRIFMVRAVTDDDRIFQLENIEKALKEIVRSCETMGQGPALSTLTSLSRNSWNISYNKIRNICHQNAKNIDLIESSIVWICLSTDEPPPEPLALERALKVDIRNTWADKSLYLSFLSNGFITYGANHAPVDGIALGSVFAFTEREIVCGNGLGKCNLPSLNTIDHCDWPVTWQELNFVLPKEEIKIIDDGYLAYLKRCLNIEAQTFMFSTFSRSLSRKYRLHPDTVFQLCLQLAYANIHGVESPATVYETATTRQFANGRTETIRSCTVQVVKWIRALALLGPGDARVVALFLQAHHVHNELRNRCESGHGCDRHILGLRMLASKMDCPLFDAIIQDPSFAATGSNGTFLLSTSPMGAADSMGAVAPMSPKGYGVFYRIIEDGCEAAVTSWRSEGESKGSRLLEELNASFRLIPIMCLAAQQTKL